MTDQKPAGDLKTELENLVADARNSVKPSSGSGEKEAAVFEYIKFLERIPPEIRKNPERVPAGFGLDITAAGITFAAIAASSEEVTLPIGYVLGCLDAKYSRLNDSVMENLIYTIRGGAEWDCMNTHMMQLMRDYTLEVTRFAVKEMPERITPELVDVVTEATVVPLCTDINMIDEGMTLYLSAPKAFSANRIATTFSQQARKTLYDMLVLKPKMGTEAVLVLGDMNEDLKNFAFDKIPLKKFPYEEIQPIAYRAVEQTRKTIYRAVEKATRPENYISSASAGHLFQNILAM
jgi:hypothetical protein